MSASINDGRYAFRCDWPRCGAQLVTTADTLEAAINALEKAKWGYRLHTETWTQFCPEHDDELRRPTWRDV